MTYRDTDNMWPVGFVYYLRNGASREWPWHLSYQDYLDYAWYRTTTQGE